MLVAGVALAWAALHNAGPTASSGTGTPIALAGPSWEGRIAYTSEAGQGPQIFILDADSAQPRALVQGHSPALAPGGERVAFISKRTGIPQVYVTDAAGQSLTQLTHTPQAKSAPAWSPQGDWIAMLAQDHTGQRLRVVDGGGTGERDLSGAAAGQVEGFAWAPDGRQLLFDAAVDGSSRIWRVALDGSTPQPFTDLGGRQPAFAPDGQHVSFVGPGGLYIADGTGANLRRLTTFPAGQSRWSADGRRLLFLAEEGTGGRAADLWVMNADGTGQKRAGGASCRAATWAAGPDFAFCITDGGMDGGSAMRVVGLDLETGASSPVAGVSEPTLSWSR